MHNSGNKVAHRREFVPLCTFEKGDKVWINELGKTDWTIGVVANIRHPFEYGSRTYNYGVSVQIEDGEGGMRIPKTWTDSFADIPCDKVQEYLRHADENMLDLFTPEKNIY